MCCWRSIGSNLTFVKIGGWPPKYKSPFRSKNRKPGLSILLSFYGTAFSDFTFLCYHSPVIRDKYIRYEEILRENMILWRKLINESAGIYEQGIILVKV